MMKKKVNKKNDKVLNEEVVQKQIPEEVRIALGKFYIFSLFYVVFFGGLFPFYLLYRISIVSQILSIVFLVLFYIYMMIDVIKKKKKFTSTLFVLLIVLVFVLISFSIVKMII